MLSTTFLLHGNSDWLERIKHWLCKKRVSLFCVCTSFTLRPQSESFCSIFSARLPGNKSILYSILFILVVREVGEAVLTKFGRTNVRVGVAIMGLPSHIPSARSAIPNSCQKQPGAVSSVFSSHRKSICSCFHKGLLIAF